MVRPPQEAIDTFVSITGAAEAGAVRVLEEHGGDLNEAVNAYFNEGDRTTINQNPVPASHDDTMELDEPLDPMFDRPLFPRSLGNPFALLDPNFANRAAAGIFGLGPQVTHPREVRQIPIEVKDNNTQTGSSGQGPFIEDVTGHESLYGPEVHGTVIVDEDDEDLPSAPSAHDPNIPSNASRPNLSVPSAPPLVDVNDYNSDIEEEMIRAAIEASKREAEGMTNGLNSGEGENASRGRGNDELAWAVSLSLETTERESALRHDGMLVPDHSPDLSDKEDIEGASGSVERQGSTTGKVGTSERTVDEDNFQEDIEDAEEQPLVRHRSRRLRYVNTEPAEEVERSDSPPPSPQPHNAQTDRQNNGGFPSEEWGGISSEEHDEAVMLEAAMFGGIPEGAAYPFSFPTHGSSTHYPRVAHPPSPTLTAQRLLREQQDDEYLAALQADQEKELKAVQEAELRRLEEAAAREAALARQKEEEGEKLRKQLEEEELESELAAKQASLPKEPLPNDDGAVTVVVRMPDGRRQGRRFLKSDKLQSLFDFIDISRTFKPRTYRLVRSYPRRAFTDGESQMSLSDLGLTGKQEALFLEQISG
ncbi:plant UBX domain-containing protein 8-like [Phragmites australis]|uniref:plant UBX domain-containing protein 8-like n=1 Tax=Phragmites australis TaxID=29695 RepID=UPI002D7A25FB|nr:plant UBX domain-containing protein 8-like [Phragmites australis]